MKQPKKHDDEEIEMPQTPQMPPTNRRFAFFMSDVCSESVRPLCEWIFANNFDASEDAPKELTIVINSKGGSLHDAFALVDIMMGSRIPIRTIGLGQIASAGLLIFMSGTRGMRSLTPNTSILSHQWAWGAMGKQHELVAATREWDLTQRRIMKHYKKCTGLPEIKIKKLLMAPADQWLDADEALKLGLCDRIQDMSQYIPNNKPKSVKKAKKSPKKR